MVTTDSTPNWERIYDKISTFRVQIPEADPGQPHDLQALQALVQECARQRERCSYMLLRLKQKYAGVKRDVAVRQEQLKIARMQAYTEPDVRVLPNRAARDEAVFQMLIVEEQALVQAKARMQEWDSVVDCCQMQLSGLEQSKQQINTLVRLTLAELDLEK